MPQNDTSIELVHQNDRTGIQEENEMLSAGNGDIAESDILAAVRKHIGTLDNAVKPGFKKKRRKRYCFRRSTLAAYLVLAACLIIFITFVQFIIDEPVGKTKVETGLLNQFCSIDTVQECRQLLQSRLARGTIGILRTPIHFFFTFGAFAFVILVAFFLQAFRGRRISKRLQLMPRQNIDLWTTVDERIRSNQCFSREMFVTVNEEIYRIANLSQCRFVIPVLSKQKGDVNWGDTDSDLAGTHFPTSIALSFHSLNEIASKHNPILSIGVNESVRDFVARIQSKCNGRLDSAVCQSYIQLYEEAKFGQSNLSKEHYSKFLQIMYAMLEVLDE